MLDEGDLISLDMEQGLLNYRSWGLGRPFLLLTASPFASAEFIDVGSTLSLSYKTLAPDLPGLGGSQPLVVPSPTRLCDVMLSFFAAAGLDTIVLCASGITSLIAMELMDRHPEYLAGVFLLNPILDQAHLRRKPPYLSRSNTTAINILGYAQRRALVEMKKLFLSPDKVDPSVFLEGRKGLDRQGRKAASAFFEFADPARFPAYAEAMKRFTKPLHIRQGDFDPLWDPESLNRIQADFPGARTTIIGDSGHFFALEAPSRLADILMALGREAW